MLEDLHYHHFRFPHQMFVHESSLKGCLLAWSFAVWNHIGIKLAPVIPWSVFSWRIASNHLLIARTDPYRTCFYLKRTSSCFHSSRVSTMLPYHQIHLLYKQITGTQLYLIVEITIILLAVNCCNSLSARLPSHVSLDLCACFWMPWTKAANTSRGSPWTIFFGV